MDDQPQESEEVTYSITEVRSRLDDILVKEISKFNDIDSDMALLSYNLFTIATLLIVVERDKEIKSFPDENLKHYTRKELFKELSELGIDVDAEMETCFVILEDNGYIAKNVDDKYVANIAAHTLVSFLDKMFPGMPGMNLVAYILQITEEIISGRKSLEDGEAAFAQTLTLRGTSVTKRTMEEVEEEKKKVSEYSQKTAAEDRAAILKARKLAAELKNTNAQRLAKYRNLMDKSSAGPSVFSVSGYSGGSMKVKDLFPKGPTDAEIQEQKEKEQKEAEKKAAELAATKLAAEEVEKAKQAILDAEQKVAELEAREKKRKEAERVAQETEKRIKDMEAREALLIAREAEIIAKEEERARKKEEAEAKKKEEEIAAKIAMEAKAKADEANDIERQIAAFEQELAMPCPICNVGKIISETTEKGKEYFACSNESCRFVSWAKPFHFKCPLCNNPFLVENPLPDGSHGLKCPRAACTYSQVNQISPEQNVVPSPVVPVAAPAPGVVAATPAAVPGAPVAPGDKPKKRRIIRRRKK